MGKGRDKYEGVRLRAFIRCLPAATDVAFGPDCRAEAAVASEGTPDTAVRWTKRTTFLHGTCHIVVCNLLNKSYVEASMYGIICSILVFVFFRIK